MMMMMTFGLINLEMLLSRRRHTGRRFSSTEPAGRQEEVRSAGELQAMPRAAPPPPHAGNARCARKAAGSSQLSLVITNTWAAVAQEVMAVVCQQEGCWFDPRAPTA